MKDSIYLHKHIVLCVDHSNPLGIIRSLGEEGIKPIVLLCSIEPKLVPYSKYIGEIHIFKTINEGLDYMISHFSGENEKPFVYNGSDDVALLLDDHYDVLKDHFYFSNGEGRLKKYLQKYDSTILAKQCGIKIPQEELLKVGVLPTSLKYPVMTKAATSAAGGAWKDQCFICENEEELKEAYKKIKAETILVQEYIRKKNELCIDGISINGGEQVFMPYGCSYYHFLPNTFGEFMYYSPVVDAGLIEKITNIIKGSSYSGIFCIEFLIGEDDELYFLETNYRHSGWGYFFTSAGYNLPVRWAKATLCNEIDTSDFKPIDSFSGMAEVEEFLEYVKTKKRTIWQYIKDIRHADYFLYYNKKDPKPFWRFLYNRVSGKIARTFGKNRSK